VYESGRVTEFDCQRLAIRIQHVREDRLRAFGGEQPRVSGTRAPGAAGDECDFACDTVHGASSDL